MSPGVQPELEDVLEAFMLDAEEQGALARYLGDYPQYKAELLELAHQMGHAEPDELPPLGEPCKAVIRKGWESLSAAWPATDRNLFASLSAVATAIAGTRWNGPRFFGLREASQ